MHTAKKGLTDTTGLPAVENVHAYFGSKINMKL